MFFYDQDESRIEYVVHFVLSDLNTKERKHFAIPVYVFLNNNEAELYPSVLDFGMLYPNSGISHKLVIRAVPEDSDGIRVGYPFVPTHSYFEFDFKTLVENQGLAVPQKHL